MKKILLIEDDPAISLSLTDILESEHYEISTARNGKEGLSMAITGDCDLILLHQMLPTMNGIEVCRELRAKNSDIPVIMLTSKNDEVTKVLAFDIGADDYITKPFSINDLLARIKAVLRRTGNRSPQIQSNHSDDLILNDKEMTLSKHGAVFPLSPIEYKLIKFFFEHPNEIFSRNKLLDEVWGYDSFPTTRTIDNFILSLRKKFEDDPSNPKHFVTIHSAGYKFVP